MVVASAACLAACSGSGSTTATTAKAPPPKTTTSTTTTQPLPNLTLVVEPADQYGSVYQMIRDARHSLDMTMYELVDPQIVTLLTAADHRGVAVRVLLDYAGSGASVNRDAYNQLSAAGVPVRWAPNSVLFHQKTLTADKLVSAIMTGNLTASSYPTTRDVVVFDRSPTAVSSIEQVFMRDWDGDGGSTSRVPTVAGLVWSPGARTTLVGLIDSAHTTLAVENEEMAAPSIISALKAASKRGVRVTVTMTYSPTWTAAWTRLTRAGVEVATYPDTPSALYIHAKVIVVDDFTAFVGSQNFSNASLGYNRELGLITSDPAVVGPMSQTLAADFAGGTRFTAKLPPATSSTRPTTRPTTRPGTTSTTKVT